MRNRWEIEVKPGHWVMAHAPLGGRVEGRVKSIFSVRGRGVVVALDNGLTVSLDDVFQSLGPMTVDARGVVKQNPVKLSDLSAVEIARLMTLNYAARQSSLARRFGSNGPTPEQAEAYRKEVNANKSERARLSAAHKIALARDNAEYRARNANPAKRDIRVGIKSPSMATGEKPSPRLVKRRRATRAAPAGVYANPIETYNKRGQKSPPSVGFHQVWIVRNGVAKKYLGTFQTRRDALEYAQAYADQNHVVTALLYLGK